MKKVYVIFAGAFTKESVMKLIEEDTEKFCFGDGKEYAEQVEQIGISDEIWCFSNCKYMRDYQYAKSIGADIWIMG